jgi:AcrR family transcriptional regulator
MTESAAARRRRRARAEVTRTAVRLFDERGYAATSTEDVAAAADLSRSTLFRYFGDKEELLFGLEDDLLAAVAPAVAAVPAGTPAWAVLRRASVAVAAEVTPLRELLTTRERVLAGSPALRLRAAGRHRRWEEAFTGALVADRGTDPAEAALLAKVALACFDVAQQRWLADPDGDLPALLDAELGRLPGLLAGG